MPIQLSVRNKHSASALADWLELNAVAEGQCSLGDLTTALHAEGDTDERVQDVLGAVASELIFRSASAATGYPFTNSNGSIVPASGVRESTYLHCLLLTYFGPGHAPLKSAGLFPDRMFEAICREAARTLLDGETTKATAVRFGAPRVRGELAASFIKAIDELCELIGDGGGFNAYEAVNASWRGDRGLDIVAWRPLDSRPGQLMLFGACASGKDWHDKLDELSEDFSHDWMRLRHIPPPVRAFFTVQVIEKTDWRNVARRVGLLLDRPRIASLVPLRPSTEPHGDGAAWVTAAIELLEKIAQGDTKPPNW